MISHAKFGAASGLTGRLQMTELFRLLDWAVTYLGERESWPTVLCTTVDLMLASLIPMCVLWGPQRVLLYNDGFSQILGARHPSALGRPTQEVCPELWDKLSPLIDRAFRAESCAFCDQPLTTTRNGIEQQRWYDFACSPVRDEHGKVVGVLNIMSDSTERVNALRERDTATGRLRSSEGRLAALVEANPESFYSIGPDWQDMRSLQNADFIANAGAPSVRWMDAYLFPEDQSEVQTKIEMAVARAEPFEMEHRVRLADGSAGWVLFRAAPVTDELGRVTEWFGIAFDVTERYRALEQLHESETFMRSLLAASSDCIAILDLEAKLVFMSDGGKHLMEVSDFDAVAGCPWPSFWEGEGSRAARAAIAAVRAGVASSFEGYADTMKGNRRYWHVQVSPIIGADGKPERVLSISRDITDLRAAEKARAILVQEQAHRVKNSLAMAQAIAIQTLRRAKSIEDGLTGVSQRLSALGRAQDILTRSNFSEADIHDVIAAAIDPLRIVEDRISWSGPHLILNGQQALGLTLATHELVTNAAKYGALSDDMGRVTMTWRVRERSFAFEWTENGGPPVTQPKSRGFGTKLIERIVASYFEGEGRLDFDPAGIRFTLTGVTASTCSTRQGPGG